MPGISPTACSPISHFDRTSLFYDFWPLLLSSTYSPRAKDNSPHLTLRDRLVEKVDTGSRFTSVHAGAFTGASDFPLCILPHVTALTVLGFGFLTSG